MRIGVDEEGRLVHISKASADVKYYCRFCNAPLIIKRGGVRVHHFAHASGCKCTDSWSSEYSMSEWHTDWQNSYPVENQEIKLSLGDIIHRADVMVGSTIVEFQHSNISSKHFSARNDFYVNFGNNVIWLFDFRDEFNVGTIIEKEPGSGLFELTKTISTFNLTDIYRPDVELFFQLKDIEDGDCIVRAKKITLSGISSFSTDKWYTKEEFIRFTCGGIDIFKSPLNMFENSKEYEWFKNKYSLDMDRNQERAIQTVYGPVLLLAVPGSGKTTVLVNRIGYMIYCQHIPGNKILSITYTRNAAREMAKRLQTTFGSENTKDVTFCTINSLALDIIKRFCLKYRGGIIPETAKPSSIRKAVRETLQELRDEYVYAQDVTDAQTRMTYAKNKLLTKEERASYYIAGVTSDEFIDRFSKKLNKGRPNNLPRLIDFDDQLISARTILLNRPDILQYYQDKYSFLCLDEAQDTSLIQYEVIDMLISHTKNIFMVGDDDQSIYKYRGAYPEELYNFRDKYENPSILFLQTNYRSFKEITSAADSFISDNRKYPKQMYSARGNGGNIEYVDVPSRSDQFNDLLKRVTKDKGSVAVLYRDNMSSILPIQIFSDNQIPYSTSGNSTENIHSFFENRYVLMFIAFLKLMCNPSDEKVFKNNIQKLIPDIDRNKLNKYIPQDLRSGKSLPQSLLSQYSMYRYSKDYKTHRLFDQADRLADMLSLPFPDMVSLVKRFQAMYKMPFTILVYDTLLQLAKKCSTASDLLLSLEHLEELTKNNASLNDRLLFTTIHSAKGMEFDHVYIIDAIYGVFPSEHAIEEGYIDEEKRLFYVGITRAKNDLTIYRIKDMESTFIDELETREPVINLAIAVRTLINQNSPVSAASETVQDSSSRTSNATNLDIYHEETTSSKNNISYQDKILRPANDVLEALINDESKPAFDNNGTRWVRCEICGKIKSGEDFISYGGKAHLNSGICKACYRDKQNGTEKTK